MNLNLLFVDDEPNLIQGLRRMLYSMRKEWNMHFSESGEEALNILAQNKIDVIVSDMRMPKMDGAELLSRVKEEYPHVVRMILSGHSDKEMIMRSTQVAHDFLSKPIDSETLKSSIEKKFLLRTYLKNENIIKTITGIGELPSLPHIYLKLEKALNSPDVSVQSISDIISHDLTITAKILQLVNSAFFGLPSKIVDIMQAVNFLGVDIIKSLVLYIKIFSSIKTPVVKDFSIEDLWLHSMRVAFLGREIMKNEEQGKQSLDDTYIAGLLHDIGKLILLNMSEYYPQVIRKMRDEGINFEKAEYEILGTSHAEVGAYFLGLWGLPDNIVEAVAFHHCPSKISEKQFSILSAVHIANSLTYMPRFDMQYIKNLNFESRFMDWLESSQKLPGLKNE